MQQVGHAQPIDIFYREKRRIMDLPSCVNLLLENSMLHYADLAQSDTFVVTDNTGC